MKVLLMLLLASPSLAAPRIDKLSVTSSAKSPEVEIVVSVTKSGGNCDARVEFGDGRGRIVDFGLATTRALKYTYGKAGSYKIAVKGTGKAACDGAKDAAVKVAGAPAQKKAPEKKAEKKKAEKKKAAKKAAPAKKEEAK